MRVFIIRHAIAADRAPDIVDDERRLTPQGKKRFREAARGLARLYAPPDRDGLEPARARARRPRASPPAPGTAWSSRATRRSPAAPSRTC